MTEYNENVGDLDIPFKRFVDWTIPCWRSVGFTPNMLTTLSLISTLLFGYFFYKNNLLSIVFLLLHMYFDEADGHLARRYKMTSKFGDYYDHGVDMLFGGLFLFSLYKNTKGKTRVTAISLFVIISAMFSVYMGCVSKFNKKESIAFMEKLCIKPEMHKKTDTVMLNIVYIIIILIRYKYGRKKDESTKSLKKLFGK